MEFNPQISFFKRANVPTPHRHTPNVQDILTFIRDGKYREVVEAVRMAPSEKEWKQLKQKLYAVTFSGTFTYRDSDPQYLIAYTQLVCQDIDKLQPDQLQRIKIQLVTDKRVYAVFVSPSGNGLKILFKTNTDVSRFADVWHSTASYLEHKFKHEAIEIDPKCKDISRLCFVSYDPDLHYNPQAKIIDDFFIGQWLKEQAPEPSSKEHREAPAENGYNASDYAAKCHEIVTRTITPGDGTYNAYINQFAIQANRYGIDEHDCAQAICYYCGWAAPVKDDLSVIKSVYAKFAAEKGKYLEGKSNQQPREKQAGKQPGKARVEIKEDSKYDDSVLFWYIVGKVDKETGEVICNPQTGEPLGEYKYSYDDAITFLQNNGFYKYRVGTGYQFIHVDFTNKQVEIVDELRIKEFMIDFLKTKRTSEYKRVREMFRRGAKNYCSTGILEGLEYYNPTLTRDTPTNAYVYFKNCFLDISKEGITAKSYTDQEGYIWKKQMLDFRFTECEFAESDANLFVWYAVTGRKAPIAERTEIEWQKYKALCSTIGYTLHRYKSPALTKAVITTDKKLRSTGENNGRSGKSLIIKLISRMLNVVTIDGRNFSFDKDFNFQKVNVDTALINFDDVKPNFDFSRLFSMITEEFSFEKKRIDLITIPFSDAPKFWISSNSTLKGGGESAIARQQIIEFSSYFNSSHSPAKEFGRMFFFDWDNNQWQCFYSFMVHCVKIYLEHGLIDFPLENYGLNRLIDTAGEEFVDYMDDTVLSQLHYANEYDSQKLYETYLTKITAKFPPKKNTWSKWVKDWAKLHDLLINAHKQDGRDRRNGTDYLVFTKATPEPTPESDEKLPF